MASANGSAEVNGESRLNGVNGANGHPSSYSAKFNLAPHFLGGNHLGAAPNSKVRDFVAQHDGHTVITNVSDLSVTYSSVVSAAAVLIGLLSGSHSQ